MGGVQAQSMLGIQQHDLVKRKGRMEEEEVARSRYGGNRPG